jgi:hypothetical protein
MIQAKGLAAIDRNDGDGWWRRKITVEGSGASMLCTAV